MSHKASAIYILAFDIDEFDRHDDVEQMPDVVNTYADLEALGSSHVFDFRDFEDDMNTSSCEQDPKIDEYWWKMVYVLDEEVSLYA